MKRVILITGASSGKGKDAVTRLIREGQKVYAVARRIDQMPDIKVIGGFAMQMDVTNPRPA